MEAPRYTINFGKFPDSSYFQCWRVNFKTEMCVCVSTPFPQVRMSWSNEMEMARSTDDLLTSQSIERRRDVPDFEMLDACVEKDPVQYLFQNGSPCWKAASSKTKSILERKTNWLQDLWPLSSNWSLRCSSRPIRSVQYLPTEWRRSRFRSKMGSNLIRNKWDQVAGFWSTSNFVSFVQPRIESR